MDLLGIKRNHEVVVVWDASDESSVAGVVPFDIGTEPFAVLHMSPKFPYKMWHREGWIELAQWLEKNGHPLPCLPEAAPRMKWPMSGRYSAPCRPQQ